MILSYTVIFLVLGLIVGSFLNVVIYRLNTKRSFGGRSACMSCQKKLSWYELIPLVSFLALRGRCRSCKVKISVQYPVVELITGFIFAILFLKFQGLFFKDLPLFLIAYIYYAALSSIFLVIAVYDFKHKIIPDRLVLIFGVMGFIGLFFSGFSFYFPTILEFLSGIFIAMPFALLWFVSGGKWMGLGDAKLAVPTGWLLGLSGALSALVVAFWSGAVVGMALVILSRKTRKLGMKSEIPFAPFLVFGVFLTIIFNLNLFGF